MPSILIDLLKISVKDEEDKKVNPKLDWYVLFTLLGITCSLSRNPILSSSFF